MIDDISETNRSLDDYSWLSDGRLLYSKQDSLGWGDSSDLWQIGTDNAGAPIGTPKPIIHWAGSFVHSFSASADGKRLALQKGTNRAEVYLGELMAGGTRVNVPQRLTNLGAFDRVTAWTADSKAVLFDSLRNGTMHVFRQEINSPVVQQLTTGPNNAVFPRVSPEGNWIVYVLLPKVPSAPLSMMRIPSGGGAPQPVLESPKGLNHVCARAPAARCVILEEAQDGKQLIISAYDPLKGRGKTLRTIEKNPAAHYFGSDLSPDGSTFAISQSDEDEIRIRLLSLVGDSDRKITVKDWRNLVWMGLYWASNQRGFYCGSSSPLTGTLLFVDLNGNARVLWQNKANAGRGHPNAIWGIPSPDSRYLALQGIALDSNVWMLEGF